MAKDKQKLHKKIKINIRKNLISGVLIAIPFAVSLLIIQWLFHVMAGFLRPILNNILPKLAESLFTAPVPDIYLRIAVTTLSVILLVLLLYFVGVIGQFVLGRRVIALGEKLFMKIPIVRTVFSSTRQVMKSLSLPDRTMFKSVVLVEFPRPGMKAVGFLTGYIADAEGMKFCKVFIPTTPNPTTGFFEIVPVEEVSQTNISIEDGFKMIISGGVVSPDTFNCVERSQSPDSPQDKNRS
jgi:uncharacterized membrane protein